MFRILPARGDAEVSAEGLRRPPHDWSTDAARVVITRTSGQKKGAQE